MAKHFNFSETDEYNKDVWRESHTHQELLEYRAKLAQIANERIKDIRQHRSKITKRYVSREKTGAYPIYVKPYLKQRKKSFFNTRVKQKLDYYALRHEIDVLQVFLNSPSSTSKGYREIEEKRIQTFIKKGIPENIAKSRQFYDFLGSKQFEELEKHFFNSNHIIEDIKRNITDKMSLDDIIELYKKWLNEEQPSIKSLKKQWENAKNLLE